MYMPSASGNEAWAPALTASLIVPQQSAESTSTQSLGTEHVRSIRVSSRILQTAGSVLASSAGGDPPHPTSKPSMIVARTMAAAYSF